MSTYVYNPDDELINNFENRTVRRSKRLAVEHPEGEARRKALGDISNMMEIGSAKPDKVSLSAPALLMCGSLLHYFDLD